MSGEGNGETARTLYKHVRRNQRLLKPFNESEKGQKGGKGAVREVIEQVMKVQGKWHMYYDGKHD